MNAPSILKQIALPYLIGVTKALHANRRIGVCGREVRIGNRGSLCIDRRNGNYFNHESGSGGDLYDLIQQSLATDFKGAVAWLEGYLGSNAVSTQLPNTPYIHKAVSSNEERTKKAKRVWKETRPLHSTHAERYLSFERDVELPISPPDIRFHHELYHYQSSRKFPALVAAIRNQENAITGIQSIFLTPDTAKKADIPSPKLCSGIVKSSAIKLGNHDGSLPRLAICEGLEDALSVMELSGWPAWAVCGAYNYRHQHIPDSIHEVVIASDNDEAGLSAARMLAQRLIDEGRIARIIPPPEGCKDWNNYLKKKKADALTPATIK